MFLVSSGGIADPTRLLGGGTEIIASGGVDDAAQISGGEQDVFGSASGTTVFTGSQVVQSGGIAASTTVKNGGTVAVRSRAQSPVSFSAVARSNWSALAQVRPVWL